MFLQRATNFAVYSVFSAVKVSSPQNLVELEYNLERSKDVPKFFRAGFAPILLNEVIKFLHAEFWKSEDQIFRTPVPETSFHFSEEDDKENYQLFFFTLAFTLILPIKLPLFQTTSARFAQKGKVVPSFYLQSILSRSSQAKLLHFAIKLFQAAIDCASKIRNQVMEIGEVEELHLKHNFLLMFLKILQRQSLLDFKQYLMELMITPFSSRITVLMKLSQYLLTKVNQWIAEMIQLVNVCILKKSNLKEPATQIEEICQLSQQLFPYAREDDASSDVFLSHGNSLFDRKSYASGIELFRKKKAFRSRNKVLDRWLSEEKGTDYFADLEDFIV
jgi:hypothetical protein